MNALRDNCDLIAIAVLLALLAIVVPSDMNVVPVLARTSLEPTAVCPRPVVAPQPPGPPVVIPDGAELI